MNVVAVVITTLAAWLGAQFAKFILHSFRIGRVDWTVFFMPGGMPSAHAALVTGLATSIFLFEGLTTTFLVATGLAVIVMYDSMTLRQQVGVHTYIFETMSKFIDEKARKRMLKNERVGHTLVEVFFGLLIGVVVPLAVFYVL